MAFLSALKHHRKIYITLVSFTTIVVGYNEGAQFLEEIRGLSLLSALVVVVAFVIAVNMGIRLRIWEA